MKSTFKTTESEVTELFRNGIIHGTIVNYDNAVVASKAWNRLFAVGDWAKSLEARVKVPEPQPTWRDIFSKLAANERAKRALEAWQPSTLAGDDPSIADEPVYQRACEYLEAWKAKNYGAMASLISPQVVSRPLSKMAGVVREVVSGHDLQGYSVREASFEAAAVCEIAVELTVDGGVLPGRMRWVRETEDGSPATPDVTAEWLLYSWGPDAIVREGEPTQHDHG